VDDQIWKAWLAFTEKARDGAESVRRQWEEIAGGPVGSEAASRWFSQWVPGGARGGAENLAKELAEVVGRWWQAAGMVPRAQYDSLVRQNETLRQRLEELEAKISELRQRLDAESAEKSREETRAMLDQWESGTRQVLDAQTEWAGQWAQGWFGTPPNEKGKS
jgi:phage shock protein A